MMNEIINNALQAYRHQSNAVSIAYAQAEIVKMLEKTCYNMKVQ